MNSRLTGRRAYVPQSSTISGVLSVALLLDGVSTPITGATVSLYTPGGTLIGAASRAAVVNPAKTSTAYLELAFDSALFPLGQTYKAAWSLTHAGGTKEVETRFDVVRRVFEFQTTDDDLLREDPHLYYPDGWTDFSKIRLSAGWEIEEWIRHELPSENSPGDVFYPENFFQSHVLLCLSHFYGDQAFESDGIDWKNANKYRKRALGAFKQVMARLEVDVNQDGNASESERKQRFGSIKVIL